MFKKLLAVTLALVTVFSVVAFSAFTTEALSVKPTKLYVGSNGEADNHIGNLNLADMLLGNTTTVGYEYAGTARVKYYKDKDGNCILQLNNYEMTKSYYSADDGTGYGIYCKGDLIIEIANYCEFKEIEYSYSYGIYVDGNLKIRCPEYFDYSVLKVEGGNTGIYATKSLIVEHTTVSAEGRNQYGIKTGDLGIASGSIKAIGISYGALVENNFGLSGGGISASGSICPVSVGGTFVNSSRDYVNYTAPFIDAKDTIRIELQNKNIFFKSYTSVVHPDFQPYTAKSFLSFSSHGSYASVDSNGVATGKRDKLNVGDTTITLSMAIGNSSILMDSCNVNVVFLWWQKVILYVFFGWIWYK